MATRIKVAFAVVLLAALLTVAVATVNMLETGRITADIEARLRDYCYDVTAYAGIDFDDCYGWAKSHTEHTQAQACYRLYPELQAGIQDCFIRSNILPPGVTKK